MRLKRGVVFALAAALLFGSSTPFAKRLVTGLDPMLLAGLLYAGAGLGLGLLSLPRREGRLTRNDVPWLAGAVLAGGIVGPVLLMWGLKGMPAASASLLLNLEGVFTALLAWFVFRENVGRRVALGMLLIVAGGVVLSRPGTGAGFSLASLAVAAACLCWAIDNNLTQMVSAADPVRIAAVKGAIAGAVNVGASVAMGARLPSIATISAAMVVGLLGYGASLCLFVLALRDLGAARTGAYFSVAPFVGAVASLAILGDAPTPALLGAGALMAAGVWLHLTERHSHEHRHAMMTHSHRHVHDDHHRHVHAGSEPPGEPHTHEHAHDPLVHSHPHDPDIHHRHEHGRHAR